MTRSVADDLERTVRQLWLTNLHSGQLRTRFGYDASAPGRAAKMAGTTEAQVVAWLAGESVPSTHQILSVLEAAPPAMWFASNGRAAR